MATRLLFDRALVRLTSDEPGAVNLMESLPKYFKDGRERVFIGQDSLSSCTIYLCGD